MALATTCPQCKTSFKVVPDQLKLRRGLVRCGACQHVFSGIDYLRYVDEGPRGAAAGGTPAAGTETPAGDADDLKTAFFIPETVFAPTAQMREPPASATPPQFPTRAGEPRGEAGTDTQPWLRPLREPRPGDSRIGEERIGDGRVGDTRIGEPRAREGGLRGYSPERDLLPSRERDVPSPRERDVPSSRERDVPSSRERDTLPARERDTRSARARDTLPLRGRPHEHDTETRSPLRAWEEAAAERQRDAAPAETAGEAGGDESAIDYFAPASRAHGFYARSTVIGWLAVVGLSLLLALQLVFVARDRIAASWPEAAPALSRTLSALGRPVAPPREIDALTIESSDLTASPAPNVLALSALLRNHAAHGVRWPALELTLTDGAGGLLVRKVLTPSDYLNAGQNAAAGLDAKAELPIRVALESRDVAPAGYSLRLFYP